MKRLFTILLLLAATVSAWAMTFTVGDLQFQTTSTSGQVWCIGLSSAGAAKSSLDLKIPRSVSNNGTSYQVQRIFTGAFAHQTNITGVTLEYGIEQISSEAFFGCTKMTYVRIPSSITSLGSKVFGACTSLKSVYYASRTPKMTMDATSPFPTNSGLTLYAPYGSLLTDFSNNSLYSAFSSFNFSSYSYDIYMQDGTMAIVTKPSTSTSVDHECAIIGFNKYGGGTGVAEGKYAPTSYRTKPNGQDRYFKYIEVSDYAFEKNTDLTSIDLSKVNTITRFGYSAASGCTNLTSVTLASGYVDDYAFNHCTALTSVKLDGIKTIGHYAFLNCTALTSITVPASATYVSARFVDGCTALRNIYADENSAKFASRFGDLYTKDLSLLYRVPEGQSGKHTVLTTIKEVATRAMLNCSKITEVYFSYGLTKINDYAFSGCSSLHTMLIPSSVNYLGKYTFKNCSKLSSLYINVPTAPSITKSDEFSGAGNPDLYVPRGMVDAYKNAGWTGFYSYNKDDCVAFDKDEADSNSSEYVLFALTVTSNKKEYINGTTYDGRAKVVRYKNSYLVKGEFTIPAFIQVGQRKYAVTKIDELAFNTTNEFSIKGCALVDTVGKQAFDNRKITSIELPYVSFIDEEAFDDCKSLTSAKWGNRLKRIEKWGFCNAPLEHDIILPVGFEYLGYQAFKEVKSKTILVPSTFNGCSQMCFNRMQNTTTFIINTSQAFVSDWSFDFDKVPTSATIYVPVGQVNAAKAHNNWKRFSNIQAGAFDFSLNADLGSQYTMTVTSNIPVTVGGVTYAGKAKYVYNPTIKSRTSYTFDNFETDKMCGGERKYLMTEIGDEFAMNSNIQTAAFARMANLERIGTNAFNGSQLTTATMPDRPIKFGQGAFYGATKLTELIVPGTTSISWEGNFFGNNASDFNFFVDYSKVAATLNSSLKDYYYSSTEKCSNRVAPCFTALATTFNLGVNVPLDFSNSDLTAYAVTGKDSSTGLLKTSKWNFTENNDGGVIIVDLTPGNFYKVKRKFTDATSSTPGLLKTSTANTNVYNIANAYYWDFNNKKFVKPTGNYTITSGRSYLVLNDSASELYLDVFPPASTGKKGDVNGDGTIDVTDVNLAINVMLGKATKSQYPKADVNGDGTVDVTDVNLIINAMLGK